MSSEDGVICNTCGSTPCNPECTAASESELNDLLCGCGGKLRYSHFKDGVEVMSCNKHVVCLTYDEQREKLQELQGKYSGLLHAVARKFPGETRHETALRYIKAAEESPAFGADKCEAT